MSREIELIMYIRLDALSDELHDSLRRDEALQLILNLDARYADLNFTIELRDKLNEVIESEEES